MVNLVSSCWLQWIIGYVSLSVCMSLCSRGNGTTAFKCKEPASVNVWYGHFENMRTLWNNPFIFIYLSICHHGCSATHTYHRLVILVPHMKAELVSCPIGGATEDVFMSNHSAMTHCVHIDHSEPSAFRCRTRYHKIIGVNMGRTQ